LSGPRQNLGLSIVVSAARQSLRFAPPQPSPHAGREKTFPPRSGGCKGAALLCPDRATSDLSNHRHTFPIKRSEADTVRVRKIPHRQSREYTQYGRNTENILVLSDDRGNHPLGKSAISRTKRQEMGKVCRLYQRKHDRCRSNRHSERCH
jgi:hypothetical protein